MRHHWMTHSVWMALACAAGAQAATPAGTVLFAQTGTQIVSASGVARPAHKGDVLQAGESLQTPAGAISQLQLNDGSLVGMRPGSELKITAPTPGDDNRGPTLALVGGAARIIGSELMDPNKPSNITFQSGGAVLKLKGADLESAVVKADGKPNAGDNAPGSYQHLLVGSGTIANGTAVAALTPKQVSYVGATNTAPVTLANASLAVFGDNHTAAPSDGNKDKGGASAQATPKAINIAAAPKVIAPPPTLPAALPVAPPAVKPCTRFIGKTCIQ